MPKSKTLVSHVVVMAKQTMGMGGTSTGRKSMHYVSLAVSVVKYKKRQQV